MRTTRNQRSPFASRLTALGCALLLTLGLTACKKQGSNAPRVDSTATEVGRDIQNMRNPEPAARMNDSLNREMREQGGHLDGGGDTTHAARPGEHRH